MWMTPAIIFSYKFHLKSSISFTNCSNLHFSFWEISHFPEEANRYKKASFTMTQAVCISLTTSAESFERKTRSRNAWNLFLYRFQFLVFLVISIFSSLRRLFCLKVKILARNGRISQQFSIPRAYNTLCYANRELLSFGFLINQQTTETRCPTLDVEALH